MKLSFETTKYYKNNERISKLHGVLFMVAGFIILSFIVCGLFLFSIDVDTIYEGWDSDGCSTNDSEMNKMNEANSLFVTKNKEYESVKEKYYSTYNVDMQLEYHDQWIDSFNSLVSVFNDMIFVYNENSLYFDNCNDYSVSDDIEFTRGYLDWEDKIIDEEFQKLKARAEAEGYIFTIS